MANGGVVPNVSYAFMLMFKVGVVHLVMSNATRPGRAPELISGESVLCFAGSLINVCRLLSDARPPPVTPEEPQPAELRPARQTRKALPTARPLPTAPEEPQPAPVQPVIAQIAGKKRRAFSTASEPLTKSPRILPSHPETSVHEKQHQQKQKEPAVFAKVAGSVGVEGLQGDERRT